MPFNTYSNDNKNELNNNQLQSTSTFNDKTKIKETIL